MDRLIEDGKLTVPLFHGTSTVFINSILQHGLGAKNPIHEYGIHELAKKVLLLAEDNLKDWDVFTQKEQSFRNMVNQTSSTRGLNFQHGDIYLSPSKYTAIRYAISNRYGSEFITYTLDLLAELIRRNITGAKDHLYREFRSAFSLLDISPKPITIEVSNVPVAALWDEHGRDPSLWFELMAETLRTSPDMFQLNLQQTNFRSVRPISADALRVWLIIVKRNRHAIPEYTLDELVIQE